MLAKHREEISQYLKPAKAVAAAESSALRASADDADLRSSLQVLRNSLNTYLKSRREALKVAEWYQSWHGKNKHLQQAQSVGRPVPPAEVADDPAEGHEEILDESRQRAAALLAAIDASLLGLRFDVLGRHDGFPFHFATMIPGSGPVPAAVWMHAVLK